MALETAFRRFTLLPGFIQTGNGEPRKAHWLGNRQDATPRQDTNQGGPQGPSPQRQDPRGYRDLASISLGEVDDVYRYFKPQLVSSPAESWVARNYFCYIPLKRRGGERPPAVFGRVKTCYPSDGYVYNMEELEMYFPRPDGQPDVLHLHQYDISPQAPTYSYCVGVKLFLSEEEMADFRGAENIFVEKGFAPLYDNGYLDLLDLHEQNPNALPWLHIIGSGWLASIPDSVQGEVREKLRDLVRSDTVVFNYHPRRYSLQYRSLNEELDFQYGFSEHYLVAPRDTGQVLQKVEESFAEIFMHGIS